MQLPKSLTTVTPFSKFLALSMFIVFPLIAFLLGIYYQQSKPIKTTYITQEKIVKVFPTETPIDLVIRCGDYPLSVIVATPCGQYNDCGGPSWSPDCRYIAWSFNRSAPAWDGPVDPKVMITPFDVTQTLSDEGVFLYEDKTGLIKSIYHPMIKKDARKFVNWKDSKTIVLTLDSGLINISDPKSYLYDVSSGQIVVQNNK